MLLGVNIDHVATLRQARYSLLPDSPNAEPSILQAAREAIEGGADSITVHVRGDRRHMQEKDVFDISQHIKSPLNLEMGNTAEMLEIALKFSPKFVCLVPETREEVTTEGGLDVVSYYEELKPTVRSLQENGSKISMFIDPELDQVRRSVELGAEMVELHTGCFANAVDQAKSEEVKRLFQAAELADTLGIQVNAGHGINYQNIKLLYEIPYFKELNIGHSIVSRSILVGLKTAVQEMKSLMSDFVTRSV